jgi:superfamily II DNA/RNA helicase
MGLMQDLLQGGDELRECFMRVKFLVLDEADRLLEPSFASELVVIANVLPPKRQTLLFSATMTDSMTTMQSIALKDAYCFQVCAPDWIPNAPSAFLSAMEIRYKRTLLCTQDLEEEAPATSKTSLCKASLLFQNLVAVGM